MKKLFFIILTPIIILWIYVMGNYLYKKKLNNNIEIINNDISWIKFTLSSWWWGCNWPCWNWIIIITKKSIISYNYISNRVENYIEKNINTKRWEKLIQELDFKSLESVVFPTQCVSCFDGSDTNLTIKYEWKVINIDYDAIQWKKSLSGSKEDIRKVVDFLHNFDELKQDRDLAK